MRSASSRNSAPYMTTTSTSYVYTFCARCTSDTHSGTVRVAQNTQSGTQGDGLKHFGLLQHGLFYQGTAASFFKNGKIKIVSPTDVDPELIKYGIHSACPRVSLRLVLP